MTRNLTNLDFMRSVAVLLVACSHLLLYTGYGAHDGWSGITGVTIFFVHTSLVLMWSLERDSQIGRFYLRRIFRIYPLWIVIFLLTVLVRLPMSPGYAPGFGFHQPSWKEVVTHLLLLFNLWGGTTTVGASWTLPLEVQMYLFLPLLFLLARATRVLWPLLLMDGFVMLYARRTLSPNIPTLVVCAPYFLPGVMAYVLSKRTRLKVLPAWGFPLALGALIAVDHRFGNFQRSWIFCLALGLALPLFRDMSWRPVQVASHIMAKYSYGIYLCHIAAIGVSVHVLERHAMAVRVAAFFVLFCAMPVFFYHAVEEPMNRLGARLAKRVERGPATRVTEQTLDLEPAP